MGAFAETCSLDDLVQELGRETAMYVHQVCQGDDGNDPVNAAKVDVKAFSANKQFDEKSQLQDVEQLKYWLPILAEEVVERCEEERTENKRFPAQAIVYFTRVGAKAKGRSFQIALDATTESVVKSALSTLQNDLDSMFPCCNLCLHVKDFMPIGSRVSSISTFFTKFEDSSAGLDESFDQHRALLKTNAADATSSSEKRKISAFFTVSSAPHAGDSLKHRTTEQATPPPEPTDASGVFFCDACDRFVYETRREHDDFHFALKLSQSLSGATFTASSASKAAASTKAKRPRQGGPMDAFLGKKPRDGYNSANR
ncbi:hypothetical protein PINS_up018133 [Pythium insidiosum]|nr:hypothetical protein PINS_up018133 [Pythium insidiosum]